MHIEQTSAAVFSEPEFIRNWIRFQDGLFCFTHENLSKIFCCAKYQTATLCIQCMPCGHVVVQIGIKTEYVALKTWLNTASQFVYKPNLAITDISYYVIGLFHSYMPVGLWILLLLIITDWLIHGTDHHFKLCKI
jgi:hypothetical protein